MVPEITKAEGILKGTLIYRDQGALKPGSHPGHTQFRAKYHPQKGWCVSEHGVVCFCAMKIEDSWTAFRVITIPQTGMYVHCEPIYS